MYDSHKRIIQNKFIVVRFEEFYPAEGAQYHTRDTLCVNHPISESYIFDVNMI